MFNIETDAQAEWALQKIKESAEERDRLLQLVESEKKRLADQEEQISADYENNTMFLNSQLQRYFESVNAKETKTQKTYKLLSGTLVQKKPRTEMAKTDGLKEWAKANHPEFVETKEELRWGEFKKTLQIVDGVVCMDTGEIVDGVELVEKDAEFSIKFGG